MIKKSIALIMAALVAISFTACNGDSDGASSDESANGTQSAVSGVSSENNTSSENASNSEISGTSSQTASNAETSKDESYSISDLAIPNGCGPLLKPALQEFMNSMDKDKYVIKYSVEYLTANTDGKVVKGVNTVKRSGENLSSIMEAEGYDSNLQIVKDGKVYEVDDNKKTVTWANVEPGLIENFTVYTASIFYINTLELCGSGKEKINGKEYDYEEYKEPESESSASSESSETSKEKSVERARYYFEDGKMVGLKHINGDYYYTTLILELSQNVSDSDFDYPSDYKLEERLEVTNDSAKSTSSNASTNSAE